MKTKEILWLTLLASFSIALGSMYAIFNTDPHHWGFIVGTALDSIHGNKFFSEIYIQYGIGEALLFKFLDLYLPINYTSIGIITSIAYSLNLLVIYLGLKKICTTSISVLIIFIIFLIHPYAIYPWPDYWAGLFLSLACYCLLERKPNKLIYILAGLFLFFAFIFRSTYIINFTLAICAYGFLSIFNEKFRSKNIVICIGSLLLLIIFYMAWLLSNNTLHSWFEQTLGAASSQYQIGYQSAITLLKRLFLPAKFYLPNNQVNTSITAMFYFSLYTLYLSIFNTKEFQDKIKVPINTFVFLNLLGLAGIIQAALGYEVFRIQNACSPLYLTFASLITLKSKQKKVVIGLYVLLLVIKFPHASSLFPIYDGEVKNYSETNIPFFKFHKFQPEVKKYYEDLALVLCDGKSRIINRTMDSTIPYLCPLQENALGLPFFNPSMISKINSEKLSSIESGLFSTNELVVTEAPTKDLFLTINPKVQLVEIGKATRPKDIRFFGNNTITIYRVELNN